MPAVFDLNDFMEHPVVETPTYAGIVVPLGDGYEIRGNKNQAFTGADGRGGYTSHKGMRRWKITLDLMDYANNDATKPLNKLLTLLENCLGNTIPFYFYNPKERSVPDLTGIDITGRYLVRFEESALDIEWTAVTYHKTSFTLREVRA